MESTEMIKLYLEQEIEDKTEELKDAYKKMEEMSAELLNLDIAKREFLKIISHEIWTPLNGLVGSVQLLKSYPMTESMENIIFILDTSVSRLEEFLQNALLITELRTGKYRLNIQEYTLHNEIEKCIFNLTHEIKNKKIHIYIDIPDSISIKADMILIQKCFKNVITNALTFSRKFGIIDIKGYYDSNCTIIEFIDHGRGFSEQVLKDLFKPFISNKKYTDQNSGLGLHLINLIINAHSGSIKIKNNEFGGATIKLFIPNQICHVTNKEYINSNHY